MWYASCMDTLQHDLILMDANSAVKHAQDVRAFHRKRTRPGERHRSVDVRNALKRLRDAMAPIRSALGRAPYDKLNATTRKRHDELRAVSQLIQAERRKLWKLRGGKPKKAI